MAAEVGKSVSDLAEKYKNFVANNKDLTGQIESSCRVLSYILAGRYENSQVLSELVYSASNLVTLLNDAILAKAANLLPREPTIQKSLLQFLAVIDYVEVFIEMASKKLGGDYMKWIIIVCIQVAKAVVRFILLYKYKSGIQVNPPVPPLNRDKEIPKDLVLAEQQTNNTDPHDSFTLKRSKKTIRTLDSAPPLGKRSWHVPNSGSRNRPVDTREEDYIPTVLNKKQLVAESLHVSRPLMHLISLYGYGLKSWKPWLLAGGIDFASLLLMGDTTEKLNKKERVEMRRRSILMLLYLLRSPFYDKFARTKIIVLLQILSYSLPLAGLITRPVLDYLPIWQKIYFYVWAT